MTESGFAALGDVLENEFVIPDDILNILKSDKEVWKNFEKFPETYKRVRIGYIEEVRNRPEFFEKRLAHFLKMTRLNKCFGTFK